MAKTAARRHGIRLAWAGLAWLAGAGPAIAEAGDGLYAGTLACDAVGTSPAFNQNIAVAVRDGRAAWSSGTTDRNGYQTSELTARDDGVVQVSGLYIVDSDRRPLSMTGRVDGRTLVAEGHRGPRACRLKLARPAPPGAVPPYRLPYDADALRARISPPGRSRPCPAAGDPPRDLIVESIYRRDDPTHSIVDPARLAAYTAALAPLRAFERAVSAAANDAVRGDAAAARCVVILLDRWARAGALLGTLSPQGAYERKWSAVTYALAFAETRSAAGTEEARRIAAWLRQIGDTVVVHYLPSPGSGISERANNHAYWAALSAVATGIAAAEPDQFDWAMARFRAALGDIDSDGYLALELARAGRALHYHRFALEPLLLLALIARANGIVLTAAETEALRRLAERVRSGLGDSAAFTRRTGVAQVRDTASIAARRSDWAWSELAGALWPNWQTDEAADLRPLAATRLGGDLTLRYATR